MEPVHWMEWVVRAFEFAGVAILALGSIWAFLNHLLGLVRPVVDKPSYATLRRDLGRAILLGLEILIIADIVKTITIEATIQNAAILAIIVAVRTFLSFSLEIEIEGVSPWRRLRSRKDQD